MLKYNIKVSEVDIMYRSVSVDKKQIHPTILRLVFFHNYEKHFYFPSASQ